MAQTVILAGELVALGGEPRLLGALGIAFGPGRDQHRAQRGDVVRQRARGPSSWPDWTMPSAACGISRKAS